MQEFHGKGRLLAIGDIHGYHDHLCRLIDKVHPTRDDQVIFLGDYIDRGPNSREVIDELLAFRAEFPQTVFLRGNHEQMLLDALDWESIRQHGKDAVGFERKEEIEGRMRYLDLRLEKAQWLFYDNGGGSTLKSYGNGKGDFSDLPQAHRDFMSGLPLMHEIRASGMNFLFVHAGIIPWRALSDQNPNDLLWIREVFTKAEDLPSNWVIVHGHTFQDGVPGSNPQRICVDSGIYRLGKPPFRDCIKGGKLTCCDVLTRRIWQV